MGEVVGFARGKSGRGDIAPALDFLARAAAPGGVACRSVQLVEGGRACEARYVVGGEFSLPVRVGAGVRVPPDRLTRLAAEAARILLGQVRGAGALGPEPWQQRAMAALERLERAKGGTSSRERSAAASAAAEAAHAREVAKALRVAAKLEAGLA